MKRSSSTTSDTTKRTKSNKSFYDIQFTRPTSIPHDLFVDSVQAMIDAMQRNPYPHHKKQYGQIAAFGKQNVPLGSSSSSSASPPTCLHEVCTRRMTCADCRESFPSSRIVNEQTWIKKIQEEDSLNDEEKHVSLVHQCGVTIEWLLAFTFDHDCWDRPTWWVNRHIIKEATCQTRCRYAHLLANQPYTGPSDVFMTHSWKAKWGNVVMAACNGAREGRMVWIDLFAVRQWPGREADLIFRSVIKKTKALVVSVSPPLESDLCSPSPFLTSMPNDEARETYMKTTNGQEMMKVIPFFRLWCVCEIAAAVDTKVPVIIKGGHAVMRFPRQEPDFMGMYIYDTTINKMSGMMYNLSQMIDVESCSCSDMEGDYPRELNKLRGMVGGIDHVNEIITGVVNGAIYAIDTFVWEVDAATCGEEEALLQMNIPSGTQMKSKERNNALRVLMAACASGRNKVVALLLNQWSQANNTDDTQRTCSGGRWLPGLINGAVGLCLASQGNHIQVLSMLLRVDGINVNAQTRAGSTALTEACKNSHIDVIDILFLRHDVDVNIIDNRGFTPLFYACYGGHTQIVERFLARNDVLVNIMATQGGCTPLYIACQMNQIGPVQCLLADSRIDINQTTIDGCTPLFIACQQGYLAIVKLLLDIDGIDINKAQLTGNYSPLWMACQDGHSYVVKELLEQGDCLNIYTKTANGIDAMTIAHQGQHEVVVALLLAESSRRTNNGTLSSNVSAPKCSNSHSMNVSTFSEGGYRNGYVCDFCRGSSSYGHLNGSMERWVCITCQSDICFECCPKTM